MNNPRSTTRLIILVAGMLTLILAGCAKPENFVYINDIQPDVTITLQDPRPIKLKTGDKLNITVHSRDKELVEMFNMGSEDGAAYVVDENGRIEMPVLGNVHVRGLTRSEVQNTIRYKLLASKLVRDPIVSVNFVDLGYYVMGEMASGRHTIDRDNIDMLQALSEAGGVQLTGRRDNILVLRTVDGKQTPYEVNLLKTADLYSSPVFYLQQDDIIYVRPNEKKIDQTSIYGSSVRNPMFWFGVSNTVLSLLLLLTR